MQNTYKNSKYYAVNIRRGIICNQPYGTAKQVKNLNHVDVIPVNGKIIKEVTTFKGYSVTDKVRELL